MPIKIKPKRSYTTSAAPVAADLDAHELAINWSGNGTLYTKDANGNIVSRALGGSGGGGGTGFGGVSPSDDISHSLIFGGM